MGEVWHLRRGDVVLGEIAITGGDFPWLYGRFVARPGFAEVEPLFVAELALSRVLTESASEVDVETWEAAYDRVSQAVSLVGPSGPVAEFLLHIDGDEAWFRWSDEPFDDD